MLDRSEIKIGEEVVTNPNDVYRKIVELLIANGQLEADTTVDDVLALRKREFEAIILAVRELIATSQVVLPEEGNGPCGQPLKAAIATARRTRTLREEHRIDKVNLLKQLTLTQQYLDTLEEPARTKTITRLLPLFTRASAQHSDQFVLQVAQMPIARYQLLGIDNINVFRDESALSEATILDEAKVKAITPYYLAQLYEDTIRAIGEHLPTERIKAIGGANLVGKDYITIQAISLIPEESFQAMDAIDVAHMTLDQLRACTTLSPEQISTITSANLLLMDQHAINEAAQLTLDEIKQIGARQLAFMKSVEIKKWIKHNRRS